MLYCFTFDRQKSSCLNNCTNFTVFVYQKNSITKILWDLFTALIYLLYEKDNCVYHAHLTTLLML